MFELPSPLTDTSSDDSYDGFKNAGQPEIANIKKISPNIKIKLGQKLFQPFPVEKPTLRKSAILKFFEEQLASSTPIVKSKSESPIAFNGCESSINADSKSKSKKATLKSAVKTFNQEINRILKEKGNQNNAIVQVDKSIDKSQIRERLKFDETTTKILQNKIFATRQTQTSDSLRANQKLSDSSPIQLDSELTSDPLKVLTPNSVISISDTSVSEISRINFIETNITENNVANEAERINEEVFSVGSKMDVIIDNEPVPSSSKEVLSHLNLEAELKESDVFIRKSKRMVSETTPSTVRNTPLRERLRSKTTNAKLSEEKTVLPRLTSTNKRKGQVSADKKAKKLSPEIPPESSNKNSEELASQKTKYSKPPDEVPVLRRSKRNKTFIQEVTGTRNNSKRLDTCSEIPTKESLHDQLTETSKLQLSQLAKFSPCVTVESMEETETQNRVTHKIDLYQYVVHRKSGFYQLPAEPITAATAGGRPQRSRRPPKQYIQAAYIPDLPPVRRTTRFKPKKNEVKDVIRNKKRRTELPLPLSCSPLQSNQSKKKSSTKKGSSRTKKPVPLEEVKEKSPHKKRAAKRLELEYENGLKKSDGTVLLEQQQQEDANNIHIFFDKSGVCISDNTISGVQLLSANKNNEEEVNEEDTYLPCLIDNKSTNVKCFSTMPLFEANNGNAIDTVERMVNRSQNGEFRLGHMKILPHKKLLVEVNKHVMCSYVVIRGSGVAKIGGKKFAVKEGSAIYIPLGVSYFIHNNAMLPLILHYTINSKKF